MHTQGMELVSKSRGLGYPNPWIKKDNKIQVTPPRYFSLHVTVTSGSADDTSDLLRMRDVPQYGPASQTSFIMG